MHIAVIALAKFGCFCCQEPINWNWVDFPPQKKIGFEEWWRHTIYKLVLIPGHRYENCLHLSVLVYRTLGRGVTILFACETGRPELSSSDKQFSLCLCKIQSMPQTLYKISVELSCKQTRDWCSCCISCWLQSPPRGGGVRKGEVPQISAFRTSVLKNSAWSEKGECFVFPFSFRAWV